MTVWTISQLLPHRASLSAQREARVAHAARLQEEEARRAQALDRLRAEREEEERLLAMEFQTGQKLQEAQVWLIDGRATAVRWHWVSSSGD